MGYNNFRFILPQDNLHADLEHSMYGQYYKHSAWQCKDTLNNILVSIWVPEFTGTYHVAELNNELLWQYPGGFKMSIIDYNNIAQISTYLNQPGDEDHHLDCGVF